VSASAPLPKKPKTEVYSIEELITEAQQGRFRLPALQRSLKWKKKHIIQLFDSIFRGYPIGSLLLWRRPAQAKIIQLGRLELLAPERPDALWIVDGQQRITSLLSCLIPGLLPGAAPLDVDLFFDVEAEKFCMPRRGYAAPDTWVPVDQMLKRSPLCRRCWRPFLHSRRSGPLRGATAQAMPGAGSGCLGWSR